MICDVTGRGHAADERPESPWGKASKDMYPVEDRNEYAGLCVMAGKSFLMLVLASMLGPAVGIGLFVLLNAF